MEKKIIGVCGEDQKKWLAAIADTWQFFQEKVQILILDDQTDSLSYLEKNASVSLYTKKEEDFFDKALKIIEKSRSEIVVILNGMEVAAKISKKQEQYEMVHKISQNSIILCTNLENRTIRYQSPQLLQEIKARGQVLFFGEKQDFQLVEIPFGELKRCRERKNESEIFSWDGYHMEKWKVPIKNNL